MSIRHLLGDVRRIVISSVQRREFPSLPGEPLVSFSFDDFPVSALRIGGEILKSHGARGTYYAAMGLVGKTSPVMGPFFGAGELDALLRDGHELGSHTFGHLSPRSTPLREFAADVMKGRDAVEAVAGAGPSHQFSYPYGHATWRVKGLIGARMGACRGTFPGINTSPVDLNLLRANYVYSGTFDARAVARLVSENAERRGWLIFYTHDVSDRPSKFGCTPGQFESVVKLAAQSARILPVGQVVLSGGCAESVLS